MRTFRLAALSAVLLLSLTACSKPATSTTETSTAAVSPANVEAALKKAGIPSQNMNTLTDAEYTSVVQKAKGFSVGPSMAREVAYVFFDPQCPHCSIEWTQSKPLQASTRIEWIPVAFLDAKSLPQGATIMGDANPTQAMTDHEDSMLKGLGGVVTMGTPNPELAKQIGQNLDLLKTLHANSVPFLIHKAADGTVVTVKGEMTTDEIKSVLAQ